MLHFRKFSIFFFILFVYSCVSKKNELSNNNTKIIKYANFDIQGNRLFINRPTLQSSQPKIYNLDKPLQKIVVTSTTHLAFLELLGEESKLVGFPNAKYIYSPKFREMIEKGTVKDVGNENILNIESLVALQPDGVIIFDSGNESQFINKLASLQIPIFYNSDFLENTALGRGEWIKFFGFLLGCSEKADSIFAKIENRYDSLKNITVNIKYKPTVFSGILYPEGWYLPGGNNWSSNLFKDAGANYLWSNDNSNGWITLSIETVFNKAQNADFWIGVASFQSLSEMKNQNEKYTYFQSFKDKKVYAYNKRVAPENGGYDYFESAYARPDKVLADLVKIFHPDLLPTYETYFFQALP